MDRIPRVVMLIAAMIAIMQVLSLADESSTRPQPGASIAENAGVGSNAPSTGPATRPEPNPSLLPEDVVRIEMEALQHNNEPRPDDGITTVFHFASPRNRSQTGPLDHFKQIVKSPQYAPMIGYQSAQYSQASVQGAMAQELVQIVDARGNHVIYLFTLSRQTEGFYRGCWMSENVQVIAATPASPAPPPPQNAAPDQI